MSTAPDMRPPDSPNPPLEIVGAGIGGTVPSPKPNETIEFLEQLRADGPWRLTYACPDTSEHPPWWGTRRDGKPWGTVTRIAHTHDDVEKFVLEGARDGLNCYYTPNRAAVQDARKPKKIEISEMHWVYVDSDPAKPDEDADEASKAEHLVAEQERILAEFDAFDPAPTVVVFSGGGYQALWRCAAPVKLDGTKECAEEAERWSRYLQAQFTGADNTHNLDRLLRLPGTVNWPDTKKIEKGRRVALAYVAQANWDAAVDLEKLPKAPLEKKGSARPKKRKAEARSTTATEIASVDELDRWAVPDRVKVIIVQGRHPEEGPKESDDSRSAWLYDVVCNLARRGVPDEVCLSVITNPAFAVSESVLDKPDPDSYAERQLERAQAKIENEPPILSRHTPRDSAREFLRAVRPTLMHYNDEWLTYDGAAYVEIEEKTIRSELWEFLDEALEIGKDDKPPMPFNPNRGKVGDVMAALEGAAHTPRTTCEPPCWREGDGPAAKEILACQNGLLHLPSGELSEPTPRFFTRNALNFDYDADAPPPDRWLKFLAELWPDECGSIDTLQEMFGYLLVPDTSQQKIFFLIGPTRSGKGTIARVLEHLVGPENTCAPTLNGLGGDFGLQPLIGKQLAVVSDLRIGYRTDHAAVAQSLLSISGEDMVTANRKHKLAWHGRLAVRFLIMTNELPRFTDMSGAIANRFVPLEMTESFLGRENPHLQEELLVELPGILSWAVAGWRRLSERGRFALPEASKEVLSRLGRLGSPASVFLEERCVLEPAAMVSKTELFEAWCEWCVQSGENSGTREVFSRNLLAAAQGRVRLTKVRANGFRVPSYLGVRLLYRNVLPAPAADESPEGEGATDSAH